MKQYNLSLPDHIMKAVKIMAAVKGTNIKQFILAAIEEKLAREKTTARKEEHHGGKPSETGE